MIHHSIPLHCILAFEFLCSCGWDERDPRWWRDPTDHVKFSSDINEDRYEYSHGAFDIGGVRHEHFKGDIVYTPIVHKEYYAVDLIDIRVHNVSVMPIYKTASVDDKKPHYASTVNAITQQQADMLNIAIQDAPESIIDSGTSSILFVPDIHAKIVEEVKRYVAITAPHELQKDLNDKFWAGDYCIPHGTHVIDYFPDVYLTFAGVEEGLPFTLLLPACRYISRAPSHECENAVPGHAFALDKSDDYDEGNVIGQALFEVSIPIPTLILITDTQNRMQYLHH